MKPLNEDHVLEDDQKKPPVVAISLLISLALLIFGVVGCICLTGCTLSFQNVMTDGTASDVVDSEPTQSVPVSTNLTVPVKAM